MKKIKVTAGNSKGASWLPWGPLGAMLRYLLFLALLFGFLLLLKWLFIQDSPLNGAFNVKGGDTITDPTEEIITPWDPRFKDDSEDETDDNTYIPEPPENDDDYKYDDIDDFGSEEFDNPTPDPNDPYDPRNHKNAPIDPKNPVEIEQPDPGQYDKDIRDAIEDNDGSNPYETNPNIPNPGKDLPAPPDNKPKPIEDKDKVERPDNPYKKIAGNRLNVILGKENNNDKAFRDFAAAYKKAYPGDEYYVGCYNKNYGTLQIFMPASQRENVKNSIYKKIPNLKFKVYYEEIFTQKTRPTDFNDPAFRYESLSWHLYPIQTFQAWDITKGSEDIVVAVVDSYIDITHPEFRGRVYKPYSVTRKSKNVMPPAGNYIPNTEEWGIASHGTHVAALAVGALDNKVGLSGIAPNCKLMPISIADENGCIGDEALVEGVLFAIRQGADVVNISIGAQFSEDAQYLPIEEQIRYINNEDKYQEDVWDYIFDLADEKNVTIVWAAGNSNVVSGMDDTKRNETTIRVSAVDPDLKKADFSNYGNNIGNSNYSDISAPGVQIYSAVPGNQFAIMDGTSMAAPIVTGAVALMKSVNPNLTNKEIIDILQRTSQKVDIDGNIGNLLQIRDALLAAKGEDFAKADDIKDKPNGLKGLWRTTETLSVSTDGVRADYETHIYVWFETRDSGYVIYVQTDGKRYAGRMKATYKDDMVIIDNYELSGSIDEPKDDIEYNKVEIRLSPDKKGLLKGKRYYYDETDEYQKGFYMMRVKSLPKK